MYSRQNNSRNLFSKSGDANSDRLSQQFDIMSQDWGTQFGSQDSQRLPLVAYRPTPNTFMQGSSQGMGRGGGPSSNSGGVGGGGGSGGIGRGQPGRIPDLRDQNPIRDIRYGLHTILSVMRDLPEQLKDISDEVTRASQQPEETRKLIKETSDRLQNLVANLESKLIQFVDNKENTEVLHQTFVERDNQMKTLIEKLTALESKTQEEVSNKVKGHLSLTKKEIRKEFKKIQDAVLEMNGSKTMESGFASIEACVKSLSEPLNSCKDFNQHLSHTSQRLQEIQSSQNSLIEQTSSFPKEIAAQLNQIQSSQNTLMEKMSSLPKEITAQVNQIQSSQNILMEKVSALPKEITAQVNQAVHDALQSGVMFHSNNNSLVSPRPGSFLSSRPMVPFCESMYRSQVSPVAEVMPQVIQRLPPQASNSRQQISVSEAIWSEGMTRPSSVGLRHVQNRGGTLPPTQPSSDVFTRTERTTNQTRGSEQANAPIENEAESVGNQGSVMQQVCLGKDSTQHFTPQPVKRNASSVSDLLEESQDEFLLDCGSSSSDESCPLTHSSTSRTSNKKTSLNGNVEKKKSNVVNGIRNSAQPGLQNRGQTPVIPYAKEFITPNLRKAGTLAQYSAVSGRSAGAGSGLNRVPPNTIQVHGNTRANNMDTRVSNMDTSANNMDTRAINMDTSENNMDTRASNMDTSANNMDTRANNMDSRASITNIRANNMDTRASNIDTRASNMDKELNLEDKVPLTSKQFVSPSGIITKIKFRGNSTTKCFPRVPGGVPGGSARISKDSLSTKNANHQMGGLFPMYTPQHSKLETKIRTRHYQTPQTSHGIDFVFPYQKRTLI